MKLSRAITSRSRQNDSVFLYNGMSGALLAIDRATHASLVQDLAAGRRPECDAELLTNLVRGRMLVADSCDEFDLLRMTYEASRRSTDRLALTIVTSLGCNFDCPYCFEAKHGSVMRADVQAALAGTASRTSLSARIPPARPVVRR